MYQKKSVENMNGLAKPKQSIAIVDESQEPLNLNNVAKNNLKAQKYTDLRERLAKREVEKIKIAERAESPEVTIKLASSPKKQVKASQSIILPSSPEVSPKKRKEKRKDSNDSNRKAKSQLKTRKKQESKIDFSDPAQVK